MKDLHDAVIWCRLPLFATSFLRNQKLKINDWHLPQNISTADGRNLGKHIICYVILPEN